MIYIISTLIEKNSYVGLETCSNSKIVLNDIELRDLILNTRIQVINASLQGNNIVIRDWGNGIATERNVVRRNQTVTMYEGPKYTVISRNDNTYKIVDHTGIISNMSIEQLANMIKTRNVANCTLTDNGVDTLIKAKDVYEVEKDEEFEKDIASKYTKFALKSMMLGLNNTFEYTIENHEVILSKYTGKGTDVILPSFITAIGKKAFEFKEIAAIKLNQGLKIIGESALAGNELKYIEIPDTVELVGLGALSNNKKLFKNHREINTEQVKLTNNKTIILYQSNYLS